MPVNPEEAGFNAEEAASAQELTGHQSKSKTITKRGPGRPPKSDTTPKRGPGRPPKSDTAPKQGPGRPRKISQDAITLAATLFQVLTSTTPAEKAAIKRLIAQA